MSQATSEEKESKDMINRSRDGETDGVESIRHRVESAVTELVAERRRTTEELIKLCGGRSVVKHLEELAASGVVTTRSGYWITILDDPDADEVHDHGDHPERP